MPHTDVIDRSSPVPYYQQLVDILAQRINSGDVAPGDRLPSALELGSQFGLARTTVRQALQELERHGLVQRIANRGVFAIEPIQHNRGWTIQGPEGFLENAIGHQNRSVTTQVLAHRTKALMGTEARDLQVRAGTPGHELIRMRSLDGVPALFSTNYSPPAVVPIITAATAVLAGTASFSEELAVHGFVLSGAHRTVYASRAAHEVAEALHLEPGEPLLRIRSVSWTRSGERYDVYETWVRSDVIPLEIAVSATDRVGAST